MKVNYLLIIIKVPELAYGFLPAISNTVKSWFRSASCPHKIWKKSALTKTKNLNNVSECWLIISVCNDYALGITPKTMISQDDIRHRYASTMYNVR
jgi:hypothetical protein